MRNSSLVEWWCAEDGRGSNLTPKLWIYGDISGRGAMYAGGRMTGRTFGLHRRENAGMSSESEVRILTVESQRIPEEGSSPQGKSGPKPRAVEPKAMDNW